MYDKDHKYPSIPNSMVALYWKGISMRAARAKAVSFSEGLVFLDMMSVKLTNCTKGKICFKSNRPNDGKECMYAS